MGHSCVPKVAGIEVKVNLDNTTKRAREGVNVSVCTYTLWPIIAFSAKR